MGRPSGLEAGTATDARQNHRKAAEAFVTMLLPLWLATVLPLPSLPTAATQLVHLRVALAPLDAPQTQAVPGDWRTGSTEDRQNLHGLRGDSGKGGIRQRWIAGWVGESRRLRTASPRCSWAPLDRCWCGAKLPVSSSTPGSSTTAMARSARPTSLAPPAIGASGSTISPPGGYCSAAATVYLTLSP